MENKEKGRKEGKIGRKNLRKININLCHIDHVLKHIATLWQTTEKTK